ncbi:MAG: acyl-CoA desaturase [Kofleriaceae bacterium]
MTEPCVARRRGPASVGACTPTSPCPRSRPAPPPCTGTAARFVAIHGVALALAIVVGWSAGAAAWLVGGYLVRMFAVTAGYHRYFSHRSYKTSRAFQFVLAIVGLAAAQQGPLWWAAHHRHHHRRSDQPDDIHSPRQRGFWWSHVGWLFSPAHRSTDLTRIADFARYPELRWLDRHDTLVTVAWAVALFLVGGVTALTWGFFVPVVVCWHVTFTINSLAHVWGSRRYPTGDDSRNNPVLAVLTLGEGWHNNHHHYQRSARQGFFAWELDLSFYALWLLARVGLVWDLGGVPRHLRDATAAPQRARLVDDGAPPG